MTDLVNIGLSVDSTDVKNATKSIDEFGRQSEETNRSTDKLSDGLGEQGKQAKKTRRATDDLSDSIKRYASSIAITAAVWAVIDAHREFTKAVSELSAITGATGQDLEFYRQAALDLGATTTFSADQVVMAFKLVASAKPDLLESKEALSAVTQEVLALAEASGMTLPDAANALGGSLNQFGADAVEASRFINVLAAGSKLGSSEINDTADALKNVGAVAASLGLSFEETNAAIQMMAAISLKGAEAGTGLKSVLVKLATQSRDEFNPEIVGLSEAFKNLSEASLSTSDKAKLMGLESITAATALLKQAESIDDLVKSLTGTDVAYDQASKNVNNLDGDIKSMSSSWSNATLLLGQMLDPALRMASQLLGTLGRAASSVVIAFSDMGDALGSYIAIADAALSLDFDRIGVINKAREETRAANEEKITALWAEKAVVVKTEEEKQAVLDAAAESEARREEIKAAAKMKADELRQKNLAIAQESAEKEAEIVQSQIDAQTARVDRVSESLLDEEGKLAASYAKRWQMAEDNITNEEERRSIQLELAKQYQDSLTGIERDSAAERERISKAETMAKLSITSTLMGNIASLLNTGGKRQQEAAKKFGRASIAASTAVGYMKAMELPFPMNWAQAAAVGLAGATQLVNLNSGSMGGVASLSPPASPSLPQVPQAPIQQTQREVRQGIQVIIQGDVYDFEEKIEETVKKLDANGIVLIERDNYNGQLLAS